MTNEHLVNAIRCLQRLAKKTGVDALVGLSPQGDMAEYYSGDFGWQYDPAADEFPAYADLVTEARKRKLMS